MIFMNEMTHSESGWELRMAQFDVCERLGNMCQLAGPVNPEGTNQPVDSLHTSPSRSCLCWACTSSHPAPPPGTLYVQEAAGGIPRNEPKAFKIIDVG